MEYCATACALQSCAAIVFWLTVRVAFRSICEPTIKSAFSFPSDRCTHNLRILVPSIVQLCSSCCLEYTISLRCPRSCLTSSARKTLKLGPYPVVHHAFRVLLWCAQVDWFLGSHAPIGWTISHYWESPREEREEKREREGGGDQRISTIRTQTALPRLCAYSHSRQFFICVFHLSFVWYCRGGSL